MNALLHDIVAEVAEVAENGGSMSSSDWYKGIGLSIFVSVITGASKLAIRKSWLIQHEQEAAAAALLVENPTTQATFSGYLLSGDAESGEEEQLIMNHHLQHHSHSDQSGMKNGCFDLVVTGKKEGCCCATRWNPRALRYAGMFGMTVLNPLCSVVAMNYASPSILAPFSGLALVWVILGAGVYLGEPPSRPQIIATLLIVIGEVVVAVFGDHTNDSGVTVEEVAKSYASPATISYFSCLAAYMLFLWYLIAKCKDCPKWQRFAWGSCGGAITGPQNFIKDSLTTLKAVLSTPGVKIPWFFPLLIVLACITAFVGLLFFTAAMKRYNATYCAAAYVGSYVMSASINSIMHYHTFASLPGTWNDIMYPFGLFVLMLGVYLLEATGEDDDDDDEEELNVEEEIEYLLDDITTMQSQDLIIEKALQDCKEVFAYVQLDMEEEETVEEDADDFFDEER